MKTNCKTVNEKVRKYIEDNFGDDFEYLEKKPEGWEEISKTLTEEAREYFPREYSEARRLENLFRGNAEPFCWYWKARELVMNWLEQTEEEAAKYSEYDSWVLCERLIIREVIRGARQFDEKQKKENKTV